MKTEFLHPSVAARRLAVTVKALRTYEDRGLLRPSRTAAGWRAYGPSDMARAREIVALRALGLSLARIAEVLDGDKAHLEAALDHRIGELMEAAAKVRARQVALARTAAPTVCAVSFDLPWPWGGEHFTLDGLGPLTFLTGPLGSGKTRLAIRLAQALPGATFLGLDRAAPLGGPGPRVEAALAALVEAGAEASDALVALLLHVEARGPTVLIVDLVEQGLNAATQAVLMAHLRRRGQGARPVVLMTRSNLILDLETVGPGERIIYCPANHDKPIEVAAFRGSPGYEAVATCLATPEARARTEGLRAVMAEAS